MRAGAHALARAREIFKLKKGRFTMLRDMISQTKTQLALAAVVATTDKTSAALDLQDDMSAMVLVNVGDSGDTLSGSVKIELELQHSDDNSTYAACADTDLSAAVTGTNTGTFAVIDAPAEDTALFTVGYKGNKRYVKCIANLTGTHTNGTPMSMSFLTSPMKLPA